MKPLIETPEAYIIYNKANRNEYYMLENRQNISYDKGLGAHGLLILHVDYNEAAWTSNSINDSPEHQRLTIIPADNNFSSYVTGYQGDPWPGIKGNTALTNYSTPAATLFNENVDGKKLMSFNIDNIVENTTNNTISFVAGREDLAAPDMEKSTINAGDNSFSITWPAVSGAISYEIELTTIDKAASNPSEAQQWQYNFEGCDPSKTKPTTDISSKLSDFGLSGWGGSKLFISSPNKLKFGTSKDNGELKTTSWKKVPSSQELTFVMGAAPVNNGTKVTGTITLQTVKTGGFSPDIVSESQQFEVSKDGKQVFTFKAPKENDLYKVTFSPSGQMYMNHLSLYYGTWTAEQLGINSASAAARRATTVNTYSSTMNSYTFTELATNKRYVVRVRTVGEENIYSQWSEEKAFEFGGTGVVSVFSSEKESATRFFDLQGREIKTPTRGLYIRNGKKVVVK
jgi:hypothetical protein